MGRRKSQARNAEQAAVWVAAMAGLFDPLANSWRGDLNDALGEASAM
jgi:hypothetical protein